MNIYFTYVGLESLKFRALKQSGPGVREDENHMKVYMNFFFQPNTIRVILKNVLAFPSFIMAVNGMVIINSPTEG